MIDYSIAVRSAQPVTKKEDVTETKTYAVIQISEIMTLADFACPLFYFRPSKSDK